MATIPQFSQCCIARLLHGAWLLSSVEGSVGGCEVEFRAPESHSFVALELAKEDKVTFDFRYFVGFTGGLKMRTHLSLNVAGLALPRILFQIAEGPGMLMLQARGVPRVWNNSAVIPSIPPARLICWSIGSQLEMEGSDRLIDVFLSPPYLKPLQTNLCVLDADEPHDTGGGQIWRMLKSFWKPF